MTKIPLAKGYWIETEGIHHMAGAFVHLHQPNGEIKERILAQEFRENPEKSMVRFVNMFREIYPETAFGCERWFQIRKDLFLLAGEFGDFLTLTETDPMGWVDEPEESEEILHYVVDEWEEDPESVIGAFLNCLQQKISKTL